MTLSRRKTLALLGGGTLAAATGLFAYDITRPLQSALSPWTQAGRYSDPRMNAFSWAILAPNPHNQQPWMLELRGRTPIRCSPMCRRAGRSKSLTTPPARCRKARSTHWPPV